MIVPNNYLRIFIVLIVFAERVFFYWWLPIVEWKKMYLQYSIVVNEVIYRYNTGDFFRFAVLFSWPEIKKPRRNTM